MGDIRIIETSRHRQFLRISTGSRIDADEHTVVGIVQESIAVKIGPDTIVVAGKPCRSALKSRRMKGQFFKTVRVR